MQELVTSHENITGAQYNFREEIIIGIVSPEYNSLTKREDHIGPPFLLSC